jgi:hypothetical protein
MEKKLTACFTGTRKGMTDRQKVEVERLFVELGVSTVYHGVAVGSDEEASLIAQRLGIRTRGFPSNKDEDRSRVAHSDAIEAPGEPLQRNKAMVTRAHLVIACPDGPERQRSGTWSTIRFAKKEGKKLYVVEP